jgi:hypothetical protein
LREWKGVRQRPEEGRRRWFTDEDMDLIVWYSRDGSIRGFQLCYAKQGDQHAITWLSDGGYSHARVDDGEAGRAIGIKRTPILVEDGVPDADRILSVFDERARHVDPPIRNLVRRHLTRFLDS